MTQVNQSNSNITFKGKVFTMSTPAKKVGDSMPSFTLVGQDMSDLSSGSFAGKVLVLSTVPSLDTPTCSIETKRFNQEAERLGTGVSVVTVSLDLPFAQKRWCGAEGVTRVVTGSDYKYRTFGDAFGVLIKEWGLLARAIFVVDRSGKITYLEYVQDISAEPNYDATLKAVSAALEKH